VEEVPRLHTPLFVFDEQQALAGEHEEALLRVLAVIHRHRLTGREHRDVDPDLPERGLALEACEGAHLSVEPTRIARVEHEPAFAFGDEAGVEAFECSFGHSHSGR
jgi:hypothetical protein